MTRNDLIYGRHPVADMLEKGTRPDKILLQSGIEPAFSARIRALAKALEVQIQTVPLQKLNALTGRAQHQGIVAFKAWVLYQQVQNVVHHVFELGLDPQLIMLDHITDVRNMGAIARSAEVFGSHGLIVPASGSAAINAEAVKASAGALLNIAICKEKSLITCLDELHALGLKSYAADMNAEQLLADTPMTGPGVVILGSEDTGISDKLLERVHHKFKIPQIGQTESLNVSVAAGIILYHSFMHRV
jgi:23S rRNA (guanosine2251-2'-O)-methyltransferase